MAVAQAGATELKRVDVPAGDLVVALESLARQAGVELVYQAQQLKGLTTGGVKGEISAQDAVRKLLDGAPVTFKTDVTGAVLIRRTPHERTSRVDPVDQMQLAAARPGTASASAATASESGQIVVEGQRDLKRPVPGGNLDLPRSEDDPLPYQVFTQDDLRRKGTVDLADFLRQEILDLDVSTILPSENYVGTSANFWESGSALNMRGYGTNQTVVLVNGRRLPPTQYGTGTNTANLNVVPVNMIERVEVLPASASAIYGDSALGGVINIILRPNAEFTELSSTYDNATGGFDAPKTSYSLTHGRTLLGGKLQLRMNASHSRVIPATEAELGYLWAASERDRLTNPPAASSSVYGATPNIRSVNGSGLFGPGTPSVTSVAPGADGLGGMEAFAGREGVRNFDFIPASLGRNTSSRSFGNQYGQNRARNSYGAGLVYRPLERLELAANAAFTLEKNYGGHRIFSTQQTVPADSPHNPFGQAVIVNLQEYAPELGEGYQMMRNETGSASVGAVVKVARDWDLSLDYQHSQSKSNFRSFFWETSAVPALIASGELNPFRDALALGMPDVFYQRVLTFDNGRGGFNRNAPVVVNEYSARLVGSAVPLPTGPGVLVIGANHLETQIKSVTNTTLFGDGTVSYESTLGPSYARTRTDWGIYGELQLPVLPERWLPGWLKRVEADIAYRYSGSDTYKRSPNPPTVAVRLDLIGGFSLRAAHTVAFRPPHSAEAIDVVENREPSDTTIRDPQRGDEQYAIRYLSAPNPDLLTEEGVTRTVGLIFQRGTTHQVRVALDYVDTDKTNEITSFTAVMALDNERWYPERVQREAPEAGDPYGVGRVSFIRGGPINVLGRRSRNWNASLNYAWNGVFGGVWDLRGRLFGFETYKTQLLPTAPVVENIENPDASLRFLKYRGSVGSSWSKGNFSAGIDGNYNHSRMLARSSWESQGSPRIDAYWQFDAYVQSELTRFLPFGGVSELRGQLRVNNVLNTKYPFYASGTGDIAMYGDWRGQTYSLSLTASF